MAGDVAVDAAAAEVVPRRACVGRGQQPLVVPLAGVGHRLDQLLAAAPLAALARRSCSAA